MAGETVGGERARTGGAGVAAGKAVAREGILVPAVVALTSIVSRQIPFDLQDVHWLAPLPCAQVAQ